LYRDGREEYITLWCAWRTILQNQLLYIKSASTRTLRPIFFTLAPCYT
jgi:hypothetical protein